MPLRSFGCTFVRIFLVTSSSAGTCVEDTPNHTRPRRGSIICETATNDSCCIAAKKKCGRQHERCDRPLAASPPRRERATGAGSKVKTGDYRHCINIILDLFVLPLLSDTSSVLVYYGSVRALVIKFFVILRDSYSYKSGCVCALSEKEEEEG